MAKKKTDSSGRSLFDHLKHMTGVQNPNYFDTLTEAEVKSFSNYMVHRFLSMNPDWVELVAELQPYTELLDAKSLYLTYIGLLPKGNAYLRYIKGKKESDRYDDWLLELLSKYYECSIQQAKEYCDILHHSQEGKQHIKDRL